MRITRTRGVMETVSQIDPRPDINETPVTGLDPRLNELLNDRLRTLTRAVRQLQERTLVEPKAVKPPRAYDVQVEFADGDNWSPDGSGRPGFYYWYLGAWRPLGGPYHPDTGRPYMFFVDPYVVGPYYYPGSVVQANGWLMHSPNGSNEPAYPVETGPQEYAPANGSSFDASSHTGQVRATNEYTFTTSGFVDIVQALVLDTGPGITHRVLIGNLTDPDNPVWQPIPDPVLAEGAWTTVAANRVPVAVGTVLVLVIESLDSGQSNEYIGGWSRATNSNSGAPGAGQWLRNSNGSALRINHTDLDAGGRQSELEGFIPGTTVQWTATDNPAQSVTYQVESVSPQGDHVEYGVSTVSEGAAGVPDVGDTCTMLAEVPTPRSTNYAQAPGHWASNSPTWATVRGVLSLSGVDQPDVEGAAFGVRLRFQPAEISTEWQFMALSEQAEVAAALKLAPLPPP